ncbi:MAG: hypothetical protein KGH49_00860 [Candidatus Micrarchaeota archaeon]|nr:hypothetical protein [Candidatus Micrarchaeota archaeon]
MPRNEKRVPLPMETPGFGLRVSISILVAFGWLIFIVLWLIFYAGNFNPYQNIAIMLVSILVAMAILAASWASWGIKYGMKYGRYWKRQDWG